MKKNIHTHSPWYQKFFYFRKMDLETIVWNALTQKNAWYCVREETLSTEEIGDLVIEPEKKEKHDHLFRQIYWFDTLIIAVSCLNRGKSNWNKATKYKSTPIYMRDLEMQIVKGIRFLIKEANSENRELYIPYWKALRQWTSEDMKPAWIAIWDLIIKWELHNPLLAVMGNSARHYDDSVIFTSISSITSGDIFLSSIQQNFHTTMENFSMIRNEIISLLYPPVASPVTYISSPPRPNPSTIPMIEMKDLRPAATPASLPTGEVFSHAV